MTTCPRGGDKKSYPHPPVRPPFGMGVYPPSPPYPPLYTVRMSFRGDNPLNNEF